MAEKALKKLEEQLNCSICLDTYTDPKQLQCHHVYCRNCLVRLVVRDQQGQLTLTCPACRQVTPIPPSGVAGLQSAFQVNQLLEIRDYMKVEERKGPDFSYCSVHNKREAELYCQTCEELVCVRCAISGGKHHSHLCKELAEACEEYKRDIMSSLQPMEKQLATTQTALAQLDAHCGEISDQRAAIEADIHTTVGHLHQVLDTRKTELIKQLHDITQAKLKQLAAQKDQLETIQAQLSSCLEYTRESLKTASHSEVLKRKTSVAKQVKELATTLQPDMLEPNTKADMTFSISADVTAICQSYGLVKAPQRQIIKKDLQGSSFNATVKPLIAGLNGPRGITLNYRGHLVIAESGARCVSVYNQHGLRLHLFGSRGSGPGQMECTYGVAVDTDGNIFVADNGNHRIQKYTSTGQFVAAVGQSRFHYPQDIAYNHINNKIYVVDVNETVKILNSDLSFFSRFGRAGSDMKEFHGVRGIACDSKGNVYVADSGNHRIQVFTAEGKFLRVVGRQQLKCPTGVAVDASGKVYVTDSANSKAYVFTAEGECVEQFGEMGNGRSMLKVIHGLAVDTNSGAVYVCDVAANSTYLFKCSIS